MPEPPAVRVSISESSAASAKDREARTERMIKTGRYDRKAIKIRIDTEEWLDGELAKLWNVKDSLDCPVEIDLDELLDEDIGKRADLAKNLVREAPNKDQIDAFVEALCEKVTHIKKM